LIRCSDGKWYVVKFQNNLQHVRILANEALASLLTRSVGSSVPEPTVVFVREWLIGRTPELRIRHKNESLFCQAGV